MSSFEQLDSSFNEMEYGQFHEAMFFDYEISETLNKDLILQVVHAEIQFEQDAFIRLQIMCGNTQNEDETTRVQNIKDAYRQALNERKRFFKYVAQILDEQSAIDFMNQYSLIINLLRSDSPNKDIYTNSIKTKDSNCFQITVLILAVALCYLSVFVFG